MDPISMIVIALATGAVAGLKPTAEQVVKDAYAGLKQLIKDRYQRVSVEMLENDPSDKTRQQVLKSDLDKTAAATDDELLRRARAVIEAVSDRAPEAAVAVGVKFDDLKAASLKLDDIIAAGTGVHIKRAELIGDVLITKVRAGQSAGPAGSQSPDSPGNPSVPVAASPAATGTSTAAPFSSTDVHAGGIRAAPAVHIEDSSTGNIEVHVGDVVYRVHEDPTRALMAIVQATSTRLKSLSIALTDLYTVFAVTRLALLDHTMSYPDVRDYMEDPLPPRLARAATDTAGALARVRQTLLSVVDDDVALLCWEAAATRNGANALEGVGNTLRAHGFSPSEVNISILDISYLAQFFTLAQGKLGELTFTHMLTAILATNASSIESVGEGYDNEALRTLVFGGNLLFSMMAPSRTQPGRQLVVSWGSAMLSDICKSIPDAEIVREKLAERLPGYASSIASLPISSPRVISGDLMFALAELEQRPELFVLELWAS